MKFVKKAFPLTLAMIPVWAMAGPVNINTADAVTISEQLKGIGLSKAEAIVEYRDKHGPFRSAEDLSLVKGIGKRTVEINRGDIRVKPDKSK
jgi:competence protein ComEA